MKRIFGLIISVFILGLFAVGCSDDENSDSNINSDNDRDTIQINDTTVNDNHNNFTIEFNTQGGIDIAPITANDGQRILASNFPVPTKEGYFFLGWHYEDGTEAHSVLIISDTIFFAHWENHGDISWYDPFQNVFTITTAEQLRGLSALLRHGHRIGIGGSWDDKTIILGNDIDLEGNEDNQWRPFSFGGTFDGGNNAISGVYINTTNQLRLGFFSTLTGTAKNLGLNVHITGQNNRVGGLAGDFLGVIENVKVGGNVSGNDAVGGLVGMNTSSITGSVSSISNSHATAGIKGNNFVGGLIGGADFRLTINNSFATGYVEGQDEVGGLVGRNDRTTIIDSYATGNVSGRNAVGGLVGGSGGFLGDPRSVTRITRNDNDDVVSSNVIINSRATGNISGNNFVGGLVGETTANLKIANSFAAGNVFGNDVVGGLVGFGDGGTNTSNSYASGNVEGSHRIGGLIGELRVFSHIREVVNNSFAIGNVIGQNEVGGLLGRVSGIGSLIITNSFYNTETTGQSDDDGRGTPLTTAQMQQQSTFTGWDFTTIWGIDPTINNGFPHLRAFH